MTTPEPASLHGDIAAVQSCGHRNVTGTFAEDGRHLSNRCDDCGYTVDWTAADTGAPIAVDSAALTRVMDLGVARRFRSCRACEGQLDYPDERADRLCRWCADPSHREVRSD